MPIYAYRCEVCGHAKDVLQKISDPVLSTCPACGAEAFRKQLTAAGFQLKGSGWYVTDFRNGSQPAASKPAEGEAAAAKPAEGDAKPPAPPSDTKTEAKAAPAAAPAPAPAPAAPTGGSSAA